MVKYDSLDSTFSALADPTRREMVRMLMAKESMCITELAEPFSMSLPGASKHIKILERANLIVRRKQGRENYLHLNPNPLMEIQNWLEFHEKFWVEKLTNLDILLKKKQS